MFLVHSKCVGEQFLSSYSLDLTLLSATVQVGREAGGKLGDKKDSFKMGRVSLQISKGALVVFDLHLLREGTSAVLGRTHERPDMGLFHYKSRKLPGADECGGLG